MNVTPLSATSQQEEEWVEAIIMANPKTGETQVYLKDGQKLGKSCSKIIDMIAPGQGEVGHTHMDWAGSGPPDDKERVHERAIAH